MDSEESNAGRGVRSVRYRYRTTVLVGQWQGSAEEAARDAVRAGQAEVCGSGAHGIRWRVNGEIEEAPCVVTGTGGTNP